MCAGSGKQWQNHGGISWYGRGYRSRFASWEQRFWIRSSFLLSPDPQNIRGTERRGKVPLQPSGVGIPAVSPLVRETISPLAHLTIPVTSPLKAPKALIF